MLTKTECVRCGVELEDGEATNVGDQDYCECCYDDMFVSWNDVLKGEQNANLNTR